VRIAATSVLTKIQNPYKPLLTSLLHTMLVTLSMTRKQREITEGIQQNTKSKQN